MSEYELLALKKGGLWYHGSRTNAPSTAVPAFFSDLSGASIYAGHNRKKIATYRVKEKARLFVLSYKNLATMLDDPRLTEEEVLTLDRYLQIQERGPPYIIPIDFLKRENIEGEHKLYLNRRMANLICRLGYDGWIAFPGTLLQRAIDKLHLQETGKIRFYLADYNLELMLCKWNLFLEPV